MTRQEGPASSSPCRSYSNVNCQTLAYKLLSSDVCEFESSQPSQQSREPPPLSSATLATLPPEQRTEGAGLYNLSRNIGSSVRISVVNALGRI
jgi:hypothetical protein